MHKTLVAVTTDTVDTSLRSDKGGWPILRSERLSVKLQLYDYRHICIIPLKRTNDTERGP
jgi:hypothetical protein